MRGIHVGEPRSRGSDRSTCSRPVAFPFFTSQMRVFLFPVGEFVFHHVADRPRLVARSWTALPSWLGEFLRTFSWCQTSLLQRLHWETVRCTWHSCSNKDSTNAWASWKYWHANKNALWAVVNKTSPSFVRWSRFSLTPTKFDSFPSEPFLFSHPGLCSFLMLQIPLWC